MKLFNTKFFQRSRRDSGRLVVISNRLPVSMKQEVDGSWTVSRGDGGLVSALSPVLEERKGIWIGWTGADVGLDRTVDDMPFKFKMVGLPLQSSEIELYYRGFSNEILWPLFHDFVWLCNYDPSYWPAYEQVNRKFAEVVAEHVGDDDQLWIHDYHLILVRRELKKLGVMQSAGFFLHIPFPPIDGFQKLPWRRELIEGLLDYDTIGFQTARDRDNFANCVRTIVPEARIEPKGTYIRILLDGREIRVGSYPISIDYRSLSTSAADSKISDRADAIRAQITTDHIALGIDRLDYTKGIPERLAAFAEALTSYQELWWRISLIQVIVPSRTDVPQYQEMKNEIERLVGEINGRFTQPGWIPVHYMYRSLESDDILAYYRCADIALITPLKDGMNLVAKEYCACNIEKKGVLVLSEFAGAAAELKDNALLINPNDVKATAEAIRAAFLMPDYERKKRMEGMQEEIRNSDVFSWVDSFLEAAKWSTNSVSV